MVSEQTWQWLEGHHKHEDLCKNSGEFAKVIYLRISIISLAKKNLKTTNSYYKLSQKQEDHKNKCDGNRGCRGIVDTIPSLQLQRQAFEALLKLW